MPTLAGWLTGEQVPQEVIEQTLNAMGTVLGRHGGQLVRTIQPGAGLITFPDQAYAMQHNSEPPVLDWTPERRTMVYRRPLSGAHVLYYVENWPAQGNLIFASEIKALLAVGVPRRLHLPALDALLRYGFIPAPWTAFEHISVVPAGSILRWQRAQTVVNSSTDYAMDVSLSPADAQEHLHTLFDRVVAALLPSHDELAAYADGSTASSLVVASATQHTQTPFTVVSIDYMKDDVSRRWAASEHLAKAYERPFLAITGVDQPAFWTATISGLEAPCIDSLPLALHQLFHTTAEETGARVMLSGLGADIVTGAAIHPPEHTETHTAPADLFYWYRQNATAQAVVKTPLWTRDVAQLLSQAEPWEEVLHARKLARRASQLPTARQRQHYLNLHLLLPDLHVSAAYQLATPERMVVRSPYLHTDVMHLLIALSTDFAERAATDDMLSRLVAHYLPDTPATSGNAPLSASTSSLLRVADSELLQQTLSPDALRATGIFDPMAVQGLLAQHEQETADAPRALLLVFTTQLFCQLFGAGL